MSATLQRTADFITFGAHPAPDSNFHSLSESPRTMAKRFQQQKEFAMYGRSTKKPKLDISITRSTSAAKPTIATGTTSMPRTVNAAVPTTHDLWDDDDDDVILLATQVAESQVAAAVAAAAVNRAITDPLLPRTQHRNGQQPLCSQSEITFSEFAPNVYSATSTQNPTPSYHRENDDLLSQMFGDDDDDFAIIAAAAASTAKAMVSSAKPKPAFAASSKKRTAPAFVPVTDMDLTQSEHLETEAFTFRCDDNNDDELFKRPMPIMASNHNVPAPSGNDVVGLASTTSSQSATRRQLASERQIKFLMERVETLKKENSRLGEDLGEAKTKMQSKEGETTLLRDELRHLRQQMQSVRLDRVLSAETTRNEYQTKLDALSRQVESAEAQLQLKAAENTQLRVRHLNDTHRMEVTAGEQTLRLHDEDAEDNDRLLLGDEESALPRQHQRPLSQTHATSAAAEDVQFQRLYALDVRLPAAALPRNAAATRLAGGLQRLYESQQLERNGFTQRRNVFQLELEQLQALVAQLNLQRQQPGKAANTRLLTHDTAGVFAQRCVTSVRRVFAEFWTYARSLAFWRNCRVHPSLDGADVLLLAGPRAPPLATEAGVPTTDRLLQPQAVHSEERLITLRRYVSGLAVLCRLFPAAMPTTAGIQLTRVILTAPVANAAEEGLPTTPSPSQAAAADEAYAPLQIAIDAVRTLSVSRDLLAHFGLLEAFAALLLHLLRSLSAEEAIPADLELLVGGLLRQIVFARPYAWVFRDIAASLRYCAQRLPAALPLLCGNSAADAFVADRSKSLYRFKEASCILQVYAAQVEATLPGLVVLRRDHFALLAAICEDHLQFVYHCFVAAPRFIFDHLPNYEDEEGAEQMAMDTDDTAKGRQSAASNNNNNNSIAYTCECYPRLCLSVVSLLFQLLHQWLLHQRQVETNRVATISKLAVQLLNTIFCDNYLTCLFREDEESTRLHLTLICSWWSDNANEMHFTDFHINLLKKLRNSHIMPRATDDDEVHLENITADLCEWQRLTHDAEMIHRCDEAVDKTELDALLAKAADKDKFFEGLKGYTLDFE